MDTLSSHLDYGELLSIINAKYSIEARDIVLHRDMIGYVYMVQGCDKPYVLKLYRPFYSAQAMQTVELIEYLKQNACPVVSMVYAENGRACVDVMLRSRPCVAILYDYIDGVEPVVEEEAERLGRQVGWLHRLMEGYSGDLITRGKQFYIDRYIGLLRGMSYDANKTADLDQYVTVHGWSET
jgi:Ser/Thr protein kinase RdoA (MazF antagonist)